MVYVTCLQEVGRSWTKLEKNPKIMNKITKCVQMYFTTLGHTCCMAICIFKLNSILKATFTCKVT